MILLLYILIYLFCAIVLTCGLYLWIEQIRHNRRIKRDDRLRDSYIQSLHKWIYEEHIDRSRFSTLIHGGSRKLEVELLSHISLLTYGHINSRVERLIHWRHLDRMLINRATAHHGYVRAKFLKVLSQLPIDNRSLKRIIHFETDHNRYVRLYALLAHITYAPDQVAEIVKGYKYPMGNLEFSQITLLLRRLFIPASLYEELVGSYDRNLTLLGLYIVRLLHVREAAPTIARLIPTPDNILRNAVLKTLISLGGSLSSMRVVTTVSLMGERGRKRFYRAIAAQGYSLQSLRPYILMEHKNHLDGYLCHSVNGRKRKLYPLRTLTPQL